jgi:hypothetical protein
VTILQAKFADDLALHRQGRLNDAVRIHQGALLRRTDDFDGLHLLGMPILQTGRPLSVVGMIHKAIGANDPAMLRILFATLFRQARRLGRCHQSRDPSAAVLTDQ